MHGSSKSAFAGASALLDRGFLDRLRLTWRLLRDERVSGLKFAIPALLALYIGWPIDVAPDFLPGVGQMDDMGAVVAALLLLTRIVPTIAPRDVVREHLRAMDGAEAVARTKHERSDHVIDAQYRVRR